MPIDSLPRFSLAHLPTPLEALPALSRLLAGPSLLIKRDDQTGLAFGGNKTRKLEFLLGDALAQGADTLITLGAVQSNHCRQTAAAAAKAGLRCELILNGKKPDLANGNLLLDELLGANLHWIERSQRAAKLAELAAQLRARVLQTSHVQRETGVEENVEGWCLVVSLFATPVSPSPSYKRKRKRNADKR